MTLRETFGAPPLRTTTEAPKPDNIKLLTAADTEPVVARFRHSAVEELPRERFAAHVALSPVLDRLALPALPVVTGERVSLRPPRPADVDHRLAHPIDADEEDGYGSTWRRQWDGRRYPTREQVTANADRPPEPGHYSWAVEYVGRCIGHAGLRVNVDQHRASYSVGLFVAALRGQGLGREVTRLVLSWAFTVLGLHRIEVEVLATNARAIRCYEACGFRQEGVRREAELYPDGWKDFIQMGILQPEYKAGLTTVPPRARPSSE